MNAHLKRFRRTGAVLLAAHLLASATVFAPRQSLDEESWRFLEDQRPKTRAIPGGTEMSFTMVSDGLNFALFRRPIGGGWEPLTVKIFELANLPAFLGSMTAFQILQSRSNGSSKLHSDAATLIFCAISATQWLAVAFIITRRRTAASLAV